MAGLAWHITWCRGTHNKRWWAKIHWTGKDEKAYWRRFEVITGDAYFRKDFIAKVDVVTKLTRQRSLRNVEHVEIERGDSDSDWTTNEGSASGVGSSAKRLAPPPQRVSRT